MRSRAIYLQHSMLIPQMWSGLPRYFPLGAHDWGQVLMFEGQSCSTFRVIYHLHQRTLGPKGHVPEEFLDFGLLRAGEAVQFRTILDLTEPLTAYLALGAAAQKTLWVNGSRAGAAEEDKG